MTDFTERINGFTKFGPGAVDKLVDDFSELFLSISEKEVFEKIAALTRIREEIEVPRSVADAYRICVPLFVELLERGKITFLHSLSTLGTEDYRRLLRFAKSGPPADSYEDCIRLYRNDMSEFNRLRASDPQFLARSNKAHELHLL